MSTETGEFQHAYRKAEKRSRQISDGLYSKNSEVIASVVIKIAAAKMEVYKIDVA